MPPRNRSASSRPSDAPAAERPTRVPGGGGEPIEPVHPTAVEGYDEYKHRITAAGAAATAARTPCLWAGQPQQGSHVGGAGLMPGWGYPPAGGPSAAPAWAPGWGSPPMPGSAAPPWASVPAPAGPPPGPGLGGAPGWGYPPKPGGWGPPPQKGPQRDGPPTSTRAGLRHSVGELLRLSLELVNAGLAGGVQLMTGLTGMAGPGGGIPWPEYGWECDPGERCDECGCGCQPGVHNCW